jgi:hypothetical protein
MKFFVGAEDWLLFRSSIMGTGSFLKYQKAAGPRESSRQKSCPSPSSGKKLALAAHTFNDNKHKERKHKSRENFL